MRILYDNALLNRDVVLDMKLHESTLCDNGKIPDMSKYHNNATITGAVWTPPYGYTLDGIDDWLSIPDSANWDFINSNFTLSFVLKVLSAKSNFLWYQSNGVRDIIFSVGSNMKIAINARLIGVSDLILYTSSTAISLNTWYKIDMVRVGSSAYIYLNGQSLAITTTVGFGTSIPDLAGVLYIGSADASYSNITLAEILLLKGIGLTQALVSQHYLSAKRRMPWANLP